ncbi:MAG: hypothetical protein K1X83_02845 [Oligoflexia bacterium]|nr:hypothetical protein [Oligoflexia bacterium]
MAAESTLQRRLAEAARKHANADKLVHAELGVLELFWLALTRQKLYLAWTAALSVIHLLELWVLIRFHYAFPPSYGLAALRIISSFSLLGLLAALAFRSADFEFQDNQIKGTLLSVRLARLCECARRVFLTATIAALLVAIWLMLFSRLQFSSAPAFRAVVFNGIVGLPIDVTAGFLLYLSGRVGALPVSRSLRWCGLAAALLSLIFLALDFPLFYLLVALGPRLLLLSRIWRNVSGSALRTLIVGPRVGDCHDAAFRRLFAGRFFAASLNQICIDIAFVIFFGALARFDTGIALLLYLVHKSAHLAQVLTGKAHATFSGALNFAVLLEEKSRLKRIMRTLALMALSYTFIAFLFTPLFLLQRQALKWLSPIGETVSFGWDTILVGLALSLSMVMIALACAVSFYQGWKRAAVLSSIFLTLALCARYFTPQLVHQLSFRQAFLGLAALQCTAALLAIILASRWLIHYGKRVVQHRSRFQSLNGLLRALQSWRAVRSKASSAALVAVTVTPRKAWQMRGLTEVLSPLLGTDDNACVWGNTIILLIIRSEPAALTAFRLELTKRLGGSLQRVRYQECDSRSPLELLQALLDTRDISVELYRIACGKNPGVSNTETEQILAQLKQSSEGEPIELRWEGVEFLRSTPYWDLETLQDKDVRLNARSFMRRVLQGNDFLFPLSAALREFGGLMLLNSRSRPALMLYVHDYKREQLAALRYQIFRANLLDAVTNLDAGGIGG